MKTKTITLILLALSIMILSQTAYASEMKGSATKEPSLGDTAVIRQLITVTATIEAINIDTRVVTLRAGKNVVTFAVDEKVKRLNEFEVGDKVKAKYYLSLAGEIREPTAEEKEAPLTVLGADAKATKDRAPGAAGLIQVRALTIVAGIDHAAERVTLRGPRGNYLVVQVLDPRRLDQVSLGDTVIVTLTESVGISLEKAE